MTRLIRFAAPLLAVAGSADLAPAGWNNVYQLTCWHCRPRRAARLETSYYYAPAPVRSNTTVSYETRTETINQRVMRPERYIEEVPTVERRTYYEPITTTTRSSYYNPVTGCCETIDVPRTSFRRREECNTVMKPVERLRMVPVDVQREVEVRRPVYTTYGPEERIIKQPVCALPNSGSGAVPRVDELRSQPPSVSPDGYAPIQSPNVPTTMPPGGTSMPRSNTRPARVDARTTSFSAGATAVRGEVVRNDRATPLAGAKLVLVSAADSKVREYADADQFGRFDLSVPAGTWHLYVGDGSGRASFHKTVKLTPADERTFTVVSR